MGQLGIPLNGYKYDASTASRFLYGFTTGVFSADNDLRITPGNGMSIIISTGAAHLTPFQFLHCVYTNDAPVQLETGLAPQFMPEYRRVVVRWELTALGVHPYLYILAGTPATNPAPPAITRSSTVFEISIGRIKIAPGSLQITQAMIEDERLDENVCGVTSSSISKIPTQALYDAWLGWFSALKMDAETKAQQFVAWMTLFREQGEQELASWISSFQSSNVAQISNWFNAFTSESEGNFNAWFSLLENTLDENQASNLFNMIVQHERKDVEDSDGVHGLQIINGALYARHQGALRFIAPLQTNFTASMFDSIGFTAGSFDAVGFTADSFDNQQHSLNN